MSRKLCLVLVLGLVSSQYVTAQGELPVDMNTGRPIITVPLTSISSHEISDNISLSYDASGIRVQQPSGNFGLGWNLQAGGSIRREVRSLPDDYTGVGSYDPRKGWRVAGGQAYGAGNFPNTSDTNVSTATDETSDYNKLDGYGFAIDTEPDIYSFQFGPYSGKFVFDNSTTPSIHFLTVTDLKIRMVPVDDNATVGIGPGFVITTSDGVDYTFQMCVYNTRYTWSLLPLSTTPIEFFKRDYMQYSHSNFQPDAKYISEWKLVKVQSPLGATLSYNYDVTTAKNTSVDTVNVSIRNASGSGYTTSKVYTIVQTSDLALLASISSSTGAKVEFNYYNGSDGYLTNIILRDTRKSSDYAASYVKEYDLNYTSTTVKTLGGTNFTRNYLSTITEQSGCDKMPPYTFSYINGSDGGGPSSILTRMYLPAPDSKDLDFWGYYNARGNKALAPTLYFYPQQTQAEQIRLYPIPNYSGENYVATDADRTPNSLAMMVGTLNYIQYPMGGYTSLQYEPHQYYDAVSNQNYIGGGLRVKSATYFDGVNPSSLITKNFVYTDSTGNSSGRLVSRPLFAIPTMKYKDPATGNDVPVGNDWSYLTVRTEKDLSLQETSSGSPVIYSEVKVYRPGYGYARYQYLMPGCYGDISSSGWTPTTNKFVRVAATSNLGPITSGGPWIFPNSPNPNFDIERGLVWQKREYNEPGVLVRKTRTYYQYLYQNTAPTSIYGVRYDYLPYSSSVANTYFFGKYALQADVSKPVKSEQVTTYDAANASRSSKTLTEYAYESSFHRLLTKTKQTAPDGTVYSTKMIYPLDYGTIAEDADTTSLMIGNLQPYRNGTPIEQYTTILKSGEVEKVTGGLLTRYNNFGTSNVFPSKQYTLGLIAPIPLSSFVPSYVDPTSSTFKKDSHYLTTLTNLSFDSYGNPQSSVGANRIKSTTGWGFSNSVPVVSVTNADASQFAFSDFETTTGLEFTIANNGTASTGSAHTGTHALSGGNTLTKTISKANVSNYILSLWSKNNSSFGLTVNLKDPNGNVISLVSISVPSSGGTFSYFNKMISVASVTTSTFTVELQAPAGLLIDDVAFYPAGADLSSVTYALPFGSSASTVAGQTAYTVYDLIGRPKYTYDTYNNMRSKTTYHLTADPPLVASFSGPSSGVVEGTNTFTAAPNCLDGVTYEWSVDGGSYVVGSTSQAFTFTTGGTLFSHTVSLRVSQPVYGSKTFQSTFTVAMTPCTANLCASGAAQVQICSATNTITEPLSYTCSKITAPGDPSGTAFTILALSVNETIHDYKWQTKPTGSLTWADVGTSATFTHPKMSLGDNGFDVRCLITTNKGRSGTSDTFSVTVTNACN